MFKLILKTDGDPSVGIRGDDAEVFINVDHLTGQEREKYIRLAKEILTTAFSELWGGFPAAAYTEVEIQEEAQDYDQPENRG